MGGVVAAACSKMTLFLVCVCLCVCVEVNATVLYVFVTNGPFLSVFLPSFAM